MPNAARLIIDLAKRTNVLRLCALVEGNDTWPTLYDALNNFIQSELRDAILLTHYKNKALRPQSYTLQRAFASKEPNYVGLRNNKYLEALLDSYIERCEAILKQNERRKIEKREDEEELIDEKKILQEIIKEIIKDDPFLNMTYDSMSTSGLLGESSATGSLIAEEAILMFSFIKSLYTTYQEERIFTTLNLVADRNGVYGNLQMKDYFIQLSYVTQVELKAREAIIQNETELNSIKLRRALKNNQQLTKDYVINFSLHNVNNLLVLGNPGVGKTTFARWLCSMWSQNAAFTGAVIPVYIQLRALEFGTGKNELIAYLCRNYFSDHIFNHDELHVLLSKASSLFLFILDGYDELDEEQKKRLNFSLNEITAGCRYILTSRPYGILKTYGLKYDQTIQLDGFSTANVHNYIDVFLKKSNDLTKRNQENLISIIDLNPILTDFAHNPLMLSFIVFIYLSDEHSNDTLKKIQTKSDLQKTVLRWMFEHNKDKQTITLDNSLIEAAAQIAVDMELNKVPERKGYTDDENTSVLVSLSQLGIGQYLPGDMSTYKFYFNSITFQEYFASIALAKHITPAAFGYILQDSYFWNLCGMIAGQINAENISMLDELLAACENELIQNGTGYAYYKYVLLLSECTPNYLYAKLDSRTIGHIYMAFVKNWQDDKLKYAVAECVQRLYKRMSDDQRTEFKFILIGDMNKSWDNASNHLTTWGDHCAHFESLTQYLNLAVDYSFTKTCFQLLVTVLTEINKDVTDFSGLWGMPDSVLAMVQNNTERFFQMQRPYLEKVLPVIPRFLIFYTAKILLHYTTAETAMQLLEENINAHIVETEVQKKEDLLGNIAVYTFILARKNAVKSGLSDSTDIIACNMLIAKAGKLLQEYLNARPSDQYNISYIDGPQVFAQMVVDALFESLDYQNNYPSALKLLQSLGDEFLYFNMTTPQNQYYYLAKLIEDRSIDTFNEQTRNMCIMLYHIPALKNKIAFHRNEIAAIIIEYINRNSILFDEAKPVSVIDHFLNLLASAEDAIYESDRRFFIEKMLQNGIADKPYFRNKLLPDILKRRMIIYDPLHWRFIISLLIKNDEIAVSNALKIFTNSSIYQYATNLPYVEKLFMFLTELQTSHNYEQQLKKNADDILAIAGKVLLMVQQTDSVPADSRMFFIESAGRLLQHEVLKNELKSRVGKHRSPISGYAAYFMQFYFTSDIAFDLNIDYWNELKKDRLNTQLRDEVYAAFMSKGSVRENEMDKLKQVTGPQFIIELQNHHKQMITYNFPFVKKQFFVLADINPTNFSSHNLPA